MRFADLWTTGGEYQGHEVALWESPFGHETISVDGREVSRKWSLRLRTRHPLAIEGFPADTATVECTLTGSRLVLSRQGETVAVFQNRPWLVVAGVALLLVAGLVELGVATLLSGQVAELSRELAVARNRLAQLEVIDHEVDRYERLKLGLTRRLELIRDLAADEQPVGPWLAVLLEARREGVRVELVRPRSGEVEVRGEARSREALDAMTRWLEGSTGVARVSIDAPEAGEPGPALAFTLALDVERADPSRRVDAVLEGTH